MWTWARPSTACIRQPGSSAVCTGQPAGAKRPGRGWTKSRNHRYPSRRSRRQTLRHDAANHHGGKGIRNSLRRRLITIPQRLANRSLDVRVSCLKNQGTFGLRLDQPPWRSSAAPCAPTQTQTAAAEPGRATYEDRCALPPGPMAASQQPHLLHQVQQAHCWPRRQHCHGLTASIHGQLECWLMGWRMHCGSSHFWGRGCCCGCSCYTAAT